MAIKKKWIGDDQVDGSKILLENDQPIRAKKFDGSVAEIAKIGADDGLKFLSLPQVSVDPTGNNDIVRKSFVDGAISTAASGLQNQIDGHEERLDVIEGGEGTSGSIAKALKDAKNYADSQVSAEQSARELADGALDARLDVIEGADTVEGSVAKAVKDSKDYTDTKVNDLVNGAPALLDTLKELSDALGSDADFATTMANQLSGLDGRLDTLEGADTVTGSVAKALKDAKDYADGIVSSEQSARESADNALDGRLDVLEGADTVSGSVAKALKDAKSYADGIVSSEQSARESADNALDGRLDVIEGADTVAGSVSKALKDAKDYTDAQILSVNGSNSVSLGALDARLDTLEGGDTVVGSVANALKDAKDYADSGIAVEKSRAESAESGLDGRLDVIEGADSVVGSVANAVKVSKDYTDQKVSDLINAAPSALDTLKELADALGNDSNFASTVASELGSLDGRLDILEGADTVTGSVAKALKDAKSYADGIVSSEQSARESADSALDGRLDVLEGADTVSGSVAKALKDAKAYADSQDETNLTAAKSYTDGQLDLLSVQAGVFESKVLSAEDITNQYVDVNYTIQGQPFIMISRVMLAPGEDFTVSGSRITFSLIQATAEALEAGDKVNIWYARSVQPYV